MLDKHLRANTRPVALTENMAFWENYRVTVLSDRLFRIERSREHIFLDEATQAVWFRDMKRNKFDVKKKETCLELSTERVQLILSKKFEDSRVIVDGKEIPINNEANLLGTSRTLDGNNGDFWFPYDGDATKARKTEPEKGIVSKNGVAVYDDSKSLILAENGELRERIAEEDIYVFAFGRDYRGAVKALYEITGPTPLIPRFAFGNWWSRYHAYTQKEYIHLMESFEKKDIPFTVATVDMDWHWSNSLEEEKNITSDGKNDELHGGADGWTGYSWNTKLFPDYRAFLKRLHEMNLKVTLNLHPALGVRYFEDCYEEMAKAVGVNPTTEQQIKFDIADEKFINAYFSVLHKPYERDGVDFWWIDWQQGNVSKKAGLDPLWALNHYHFLDNGLNHEALILSRYAGIGSHRYPLGFSGDTHVTWETMKYIPYFTATATNAGYTWWSHDIGGHMCGIKDDELYVRFVQFGVFSPINRLHCSNNLTFTKEPFAYKNGTGKIVEEFLRFRHRMIPFLYSASYENSKYGKSLIEPMYYEYPDFEEAYEYKEQYMFGGQLLVAPVVEHSKNYGMTATKTWLPEGRWTDIFTGDTYSGNREISLVRYLDSIPVLAREGAVFVLDGRTRSNAWDVPEELTVMLFNGTSDYTLHEEKDGAFVHTKFTMEEEGKGENKKQKLFLEVESDESVIFERKIELMFENLLFADVMTMKNGEEIEVVTDDNGVLSVVLKNVAVGDRFEMTLCNMQLRTESSLDRIRNELTCFQMSNLEKENLFERLQSAEEKSYEKIITEWDLPDIFRARLLEVI